MLSDCLCPEGNYLPKGAEVCQKCPKGMSCKVGSAMKNFDVQPAEVKAGAVGADGEFPKLLPRYWSHPAKPLSVFLCLNEKLCPGGIPSACADGREDSIMCANCASGYHGFGSACLPCSEFEASRFLFPIIPLGFGPLFILVAYRFANTPVQRWSTPKSGLVGIAVTVIMSFQVLGVFWKCNVVVPPDSSLSDTLGSFSVLNAGLSLLRLKCNGLQDFTAQYSINASWPLMADFMFVFTWLVSVLAQLALKAFKVKRLDFNVLFCAFGALIEPASSTWPRSPSKSSIATSTQMVKVRCKLHPTFCATVSIFAILLYCVCSVATAVWVLTIAPRSLSSSL